MRNDYLFISACLDASGSMASRIDDVIGGINKYINDQRVLPGKCDIYLTKFDDIVEVIFDGVDVKTVPPITRKDYYARGMTALWDAVSNLINVTGQKLAAMDEADRPARVLCVIFTDGHENASREATKSRISEMIKLQKETYSWEFVFIGTDFNSISDAGDVGIAVGNTLRFGNSPAAYNAAFSTLSSNTSGYRCATRSDMSFTAEQKAEAEELLRTQSNP